jgi:hypothetical protein
MLTADTITDEQIRELYKERADLSPDEHRATVAALAPGLGREDARRAARAHCAEILNARGIRVGMRVHMTTRGGSHGSDTGTVRELVTPKGRRRALVAWDSDHCDQFVDVDKLTEAL